MRAALNQLSTLVYDPTSQDYIQARDEVNRLWSRYRTEELGLIVHNLSVPLPPLPPQPPPPPPPPLQEPSSVQQPQQLQQQQIAGTDVPDTEPVRLTANYAPSTAPMPDLVNNTLTSSLQPEYNRLSSQDRLAGTSVRARVLACIRLFSTFQRFFSYRQQAAVTRLMSRFNYNIRDLESLDALSIPLFSDPSYPQFASFEARVNSFKKAELDDSWDIGQMARAGFFFWYKPMTGHLAIRCFSCDVAVTVVESKTAASYHIRCDPLCPFIHSRVSYATVKAQYDRLKAVPNAREIDSNHLFNAPAAAAAAGEEDEPEEKCSVCLDARRKIVFLPCTHQATCSECAPALRTCPLCRTPIRAFINPIK